MTEKPSHKDIAYEALGIIEELVAALKSIVSDIEEYERINNLAPSPGKQDCWQSVTHAKALIAMVEGANDK